MHTHKQLLVVAGLLLALVPLSLTEMTASLIEKQQAEEELNKALDAATATYRSGRGLFSVQQQREDELLEKDEELNEIIRRKRDVRLELAELNERAEELRDRYNIDITNSGAVLAMVQAEEKRFAEFVRYLQSRSTTLVAGNDLGLTVLRQMLHASLGDITSASLRERALARARSRAFSVVMEAKQAMEESEELRAQHAALLGEYEGKWNEYTDVQESVHAAAARIAEVQRITKEVHNQVLKLQADLARIDAKLRAGIERELIEKGLMDARPGERSDGAVRSSQNFMWPVVGRISAGFHNSSYRKFFGVDHKGIDIVVGHGTPVFAADDGIVFLARDGGQYGYSYVLVGHRNGYATLYGHLSNISVSNGEQLTKGQVLGLSGGTPGTYGAGPMTTGAHLHFEVIRNGSHVDPMLVLP